MPRLDRLSQIARNNLLTLPAQVNETAPFVRPAKLLGACRLAIVTTAGLHRRGDRLFTPGDQTYRVIDSDTPTVDIIQSHTSIGFDRVPTMRDVNISFPIDRLRELIARRELGGLGPSCYSFMGAQREVARVESETHLAMTPSAGGEEIARWFWGETAAGRLLRRVRDRLDASTDPRWKAAAFGIAR